jgi:ribonuclease P/MRP protein subunit RPP40
MESIIRDAMTQHLQTNKLIKDSQHGFLKDRSCATNLLEFLEKATTVVDSGKGFDVIYLDFAKAFDKVPVERLLNKCRAHGIRGRVLHWIRGWLTGRRQRVVLNGKFSSWEEVLSGVPQGSVLGPLLFVIFINDMDDTVEGPVDILRKFADDTKLGRTVEKDEDRARLQEALDKLCSWASKWGMVFNVAKCKVMHMGSRNPGFSYTMNNQTLDSTAEERDIGVMISENLKLAAQCAKAAKTAQGVLGQLTRAFHYRDRHVFMRLYKQYVRPHLEFSTQAWSPWTEGDKSCLEKVQQRATYGFDGSGSVTLVVILSPPPSPYLNGPGLRSIARHVRQDSS